MHSREELEDVKSDKTQGKQPKSRLLCTATSANEVFVMCVGSSPDDVLSC